MSKLIERLEKVGIAVSAPFGFGATRSPEKAPPLLLLALSGIEASKALSQLQPDTLIIATPQVEQNGLAAAKGMAGAALWGLWPEAVTGSSLSVLHEEGGDFFIFSTTDTPAEVLAGEELGRIVAIPVDLPEELGRSLEELPVDAVLLAGLEEASPLSVRDLMQVRAARDLTAKPLLLLRARGLSQEELSVLQDAGIQAVVLDLRTMEGAEAVQVQEAVEGLSPRKVKRKPATPVLPRHSAGVSLAGRREEEEEEAEEEDY